MSENDKKIVLQFSDNLDNNFMNVIYGKVAESLGALGFKITTTQIKQTKYNQKRTNECVPFSIQNKIDFITETESDFVNENVNKQRVRFRAEQAILVYLLTGENCLLHYNKEDAQERGVTYKDCNWYQNYQIVCKEIDFRISRLSLNDLKK